MLLVNQEHINGRQVSPELSHKSCGYILSGKEEKAENLSMLNSILGTIDNSAECLWTYFGGKVCKKRLEKAIIIKKKKKKPVSSVAPEKDGRRHRQGEKGVRSPC